MDEHFVSKTLFAIVGAVWIIVQALIGFLFRYWFNRNEEDKREMKRDIRENRTVVEDKLTVIVKDIQLSVESLRSVVVDIKELVTVVKTQHDEQILTINRRLQDKRDWLEDHDEILARHDREIAEVRASCKHNHK